MYNSNRSNKLVVPGAREAMDKFKMEAANEVGVNLKQGYNGDLTSRQAGSVGGQMVKKMIESYENGLKYSEFFPEHERRRNTAGEEKARDEGFVPRFFQLGTQKKFHTKDLTCDRAYDRRHSSPEKM